VAGSRKLLIFKAFQRCQISQQISQALDFAGLAAARPLPINKVIHRLSGCLVKGFEFKDLSAKAGASPRMSG
jgi:hypothetical protein